MKRRNLTDPKEALKKAAQIILASNIRGIRTDHKGRLADQDFGFDGGHVSVSYERGWAMGCDLNISMAYGEPEKEKNGTIHEIRIARVQVSWSSTGRTPAAALAAVTLYSEVTALAAEIETVLGETTYGKTYPPKAKK